MKQKQKGGSFGLAEQEEVSFKGAPSEPPPPDLSPSERRKAAYSSASLEARKRVYRRWKDGSCFCGGAPSFDEFDKLVTSGKLDHEIDDV